MRNGKHFWLQTRSPVATAYYKLMPEITLKKRIEGEEARRLKSLCPAKVFDLEGVLFSMSRVDHVAVVKRPSACTSCRECIREDNGYQDRIELAKV